MTEIQLIQPRYLEAKLAPTEGDILCNNLKKELVVETVPPTLDHKHLVRTAYRKGEEIIQRTYLLEFENECKCRLTYLGSFEGRKTLELYQKRLIDAGL